MTRKEYKTLLSSDYWKGYSYSLIKERNFTCADCGQRFERNKLNVHHLNYRDANPWSYAPNEVVVLCRDCHRKRHGLVSATEDQYNQQYEKNSYQSRGDSDFDGYRVYYEDNRRKIFTKRNVLFALLILILILICVFYFTQHESQHKDLPDINQVRAEVYAKQKHSKTTNTATKKSHVNKVDEVDEVKEVDDASGDQFPKIKLDIAQEVENVGETTPNTSKEVLSEQKTSRHEIMSKLMEEENRQQLSKRKKKESESIESTLEKLEREHHASVVKDAKRAGVSTEGTTLEILDRIHHASVVKDAKRAGVSTEGTTLEIMERITRKRLGN